jgi:hypothetical protein
MTVSIEVAERRGTHSGRQLLAADAGVKPNEYTLVGDSINHLVDVYPQGVGEHVDIFARGVNDTLELPVVHLTATSLWFYGDLDPHSQARSALGCNGLSPVSTDAMTTDELTN